MYNDIDAYNNPQLVDLFYTSFSYDGMSLTRDSNHLNFLEKEQHLDYGTISSLTGISITFSMNQHSMIFLGLQAFDEC